MNFDIVSLIFYNLPWTVFNRGKQGLVNKALLLCTYFNNLNSSIFPTAASAVSVPVPIHPASAFADSPEKMAKSQI